jgi:hypothetical protein
MPARHWLLAIMPGMATKDTDQGTAIMHDLSERLRLKCPSWRSLAKDSRRPARRRDEVSDDLYVVRSSI